ncbi:MAG: bifunctional riboflavin kinase/FAD synthetase [Cyanobacteria bacterium CRU_2_1]|nr:bifunctional riboflavin kinase/FAD synthetase [Cyanobacteria bacterium RU_5_0]NJR62927.1 bifunctional riboflavin kinase/FAD synthetase [Cyanobacteria bacterium CRU_2_1]
MWIISSLDTVKTPTFVALGNFDGIHRGHQQVIKPVLGTTHSTVVTFHPHPQEFFTGQQRTLLTPLDEKAQCLQQMGIEQLVLVPFNRALANLTPQEFVETVLVQHLQVKQISVGQDFCFGRHRSGTATDLQTIAAQYDIPVEIIPLHTSDGERISSSAIRHALEQGDLQRANHLLGKSYALIGQVMHGQQLGRTIGFPTANLKLPPEKFLPRQGVYSVWVSSSEWVTHHPGVMNIGYRPTVDGTQQTIEVHLLDWTGDLYGQTLTIRLDHFLRPEQKFASLDELKAQIQTDCEIARSRLTRHQPA